MLGQKDHAQPQINKTSDNIREAFHLAAAAATACAAGYWAGPKILVGAAAATGSLAFLVNKYGDLLTSSAFERRNINDNLSRQLHQTIQDFSKKANFAAVPQLFDFVINRNRLSKTDIINGSPAQFQRVVNAAAIGLKNPAVAVSESLLQMTSDQEQSAVIAHEFSHLAGQHSRLRLAAGWLQSTTMITAVYGLGHAVTESGWAMGAVSIFGCIAASTIGKKMLPSPEESFTREGELKPEARRKRMVILGAQEAVSIGLLSFANPVPVLTAVAIEHGFFWTSNLIAKHHSRGQEFFADRNAVKFFEADPLASITLLRKLDAWTQRDEPEVYQSHDLSSGSLYAKAGKRVESLFWTHPSTPRRCKQLAKIARKMGIAEDAIQNALNQPVDISALPSRKLLVEEFEKKMQTPGQQAERKKLALQLLEEIQEQRLERDSLVNNIKAHEYTGPKVFHPIKRLFGFTAAQLIKRVETGRIEKAAKEAKSLGCDQSKLEKALNGPLNAKAIRRRIAKRRAAEKSNNSPAA